MYIAQEVYRKKASKVKKEAEETQKTKTIDKKSKLAGNLKNNFFHRNPHNKNKVGACWPVSFNI